MAPNHGGDPLGSILGPMGSHWVKKMGQNRKKLPCPKIRIFDHSAVIVFGQNPTLRLWRQITVGPWGPSWGQWGPIGSKKWVKTVKNYHAPKFEFSTTPRSSIAAKIRHYGYGAKSRWGPPRVHLGAYGVPLGPKYGSKPWKITMPQNSNFLQPRGHRLRPKSDITVLAPNDGGDPLGSILGPMGSHWVQKMGQNLRKLRCPKIRIFNYPAVIHFGQNPTLGFWRQITVGTP